MSTRKENDCETDDQAGDERGEPFQESIQHGGLLSHLGTFGWKIHWRIETNAATGANRSKFRPMTIPNLVVCYVAPESLLANRQGK